MNVAFPQKETDVDTTDKKMDRQGKPRYEISLRLFVIPLAIRATVRRADGTSPVDAKYIGTPTVFAATSDPVRF